MSTHRETYTAYSVGCAVVWGALLPLGRRRLDAAMWRRLQTVCGGWWMGSASATIARVGYPPPKPLTPAGRARLRAISTALVGLGLTSAARALIAGRRSPTSARDG